MIDENPCLRVLITGISGLIGAAMKEFLQAQGHEVIGLSYKGTKGSLQFFTPVSLVGVTR